jgi:chromosome segregation ATPase
LARACTAAARELKAARELIAGYESQIAASDARIQLAQQQLDSLRKLQMLSEAKAQELETVISAEREAKAAAVEQIEVQKKRIASLEKKASFYKKFAVVAGTAAIVAILIGVRR